MGVGPGRSLQRHALWLVVTVITVTFTFGVSAAAASTPSPGAPSATTASIMLSPGQLQFIGGTPGAVTFKGTADERATGSIDFDVSDATGSGLGWKIQGVGSLFSNGTGHTLPADAATIVSAPDATCDQRSACVLAQDAVHYPYVLPSGEGATATTLFDATAGTGMGDETITPTFTLSLPPLADAASYSATWSFTLSSGP